MVNVVILRDGYNKRMAHIMVLSFCGGLKTFRIGMLILNHNLLA